MMYGYACRRDTEQEYVLDRQVEELNYYARTFREEITIVTEVIDISVAHEPYFKKEFKKLLEVIKPEDKIVFTSLDYMFPTTVGIASTLSYFYYKKVQAIVLDFPMLQTLEVNRALEQATEPITAYRAMIDPLLQYRLFLRHKGVKGVV